MNRCRVTVTWADLNWRKMRCVLQERHDGPHSDGLLWFDDLGYRMPGGRDMERFGQPIPSDRHWFVPDGDDGIYCRACNLPRYNMRHVARKGSAA